MCLAELHDGLESAWALGEVVRSHFTALGLPCHPHPHSRGGDLVHKLYGLLVEANDNFYSTSSRCGGGPTKVRAASPAGGCRFPASPGRPRVSADRLHLKDDMARTRFREFTAAARCHPTVWNVSVTVGPEAGPVEFEALVEEGFVDDNLGIDPEGEDNQWNLDLHE